MRIVAGAVLVMALFLPAPAARANFLQGDAEPADENDGDFSRDLGHSETESGGSDGDDDSGGGEDEPAPKIPCRWSPLTTTEQQVDGLNTVLNVLLNGPLVGANERFVIEYFSIDDILQRYDDGGARFERYERADCGGATELTADEVRGWRWRASVPPEAWILRDDVILVVSGSIQVPEPEISPPSRAAVNLGLWLAVTDTGPIVAEGSLGPLWLRGTATLDETTFDPGNGTAPIICAGGGSPIENPDTVAEGPCGYTYRTTADVNADVNITITSTWSVTWETSDGSSAGEPPEIIQRTLTIPYDVYEIQTVGTDG